MRASQRNIMVHAVVLAGVALFGVSGCGGLKTYPVRGKVELVGGEVKQLAGNHVEAALQSDPTVRASGVIQPDGRFTLETLDAGVIRKGAPEGSYQVRIILSDEDKGSWQQAVQAIDPRFLEFQTSDLSFQVPTGEVTLKVSQR